MARININENTFADRRFLKFVELMGSHELAIGCAVIIWQVAQKYWCPDKKLIPKAVFQQLRGWEEFTRVDLSVRRVQGYYVRGSTQYFAWLCQKFEASHKASESRGKKVTETHRDVIGSHPPSPSPSPSPVKENSPLPPSRGRGSLEEIRKKSIEEKQREADSFCKATNFVAKNLNELGILGS